MLMKFTAGLMFVLATMFSGISWNPINGKMSGFGIFICVGYTAWSTFQSDSNQFVPRLLYVYCAILLLGGLHIFAFPSNPLVAKVIGKSNTKNNHGNFSDQVFFGLFAVSMLWFFYPDHLYQDYGPLKATFTARTSDLDVLVRFTAGLLLAIGAVFSAVKWNPVNGKMAGLGCFICAGYTAFCKYSADAGEVKPNLFYAYAALLFLGGLHIFAFSSNPPLKQTEKGD
jgi:hypothetical protein